MFDLVPDPDNAGVGEIFIFYPSRCNLGGFYFMKFKEFLKNNIAYLIAIVMNLAIVGFLFGPWLPIYGIGFFVILGIFKLLRIKKPILVFIVGALVATIAELTASYIIEAAGGSKMWDYTGYFLNFNGRIALVPSLMFGLLIWVAICVIHPLIIKLQKNTVDSKIHNVIFIILAVLFAVDLICRIWLGSNI